MIVNNHFEPEHVQTLHRALDELEAEGIRAGYLDLTRRERAPRLTEEFKLGECHAGPYETSLVLADEPELVDAEAMASLPYVAVSLPKVIAAGMKDFVRWGSRRPTAARPPRRPPRRARRPTRCWPR